MEEFPPLAQVRRAWNTRENSRRRVRLRCGVSSCDGCNVGDVVELGRIVRIVINVGIVWLGGVVEDASLGGNCSVSFVC